MIHWLTESLGTSSRESVKEKTLALVDVRDLVDGPGNSNEVLLDKINSVTELLKQNKRVVICCDYGLSRSNAIAVGALMNHYGHDFDSAVSLVAEKTESKAIRVDLLGSVRRALKPNEKNTARTKDRSILVTGGTGFIGRILVSSLSQNYCVVMPSRSELDLAENAIGLDRLVRESGVNTVVHLANPRVYTTTQSMGQTIIILKNLLDVAKENNLDIVYLSGWVVYSGYFSPVIASESLPLRPKGTYGATKALCENLVTQYREVYGLSVTMIRLSAVYGIGSDKPRFIHTFLDKALRNEPIFTHNYLNGLPVLDLLHVRDAARAIKCAIDMRSAQSQDFNIGSGRVHSTLEIANLIRELCGSSSVIREHDVNDYTSNVTMNTTKAKELLRWQPTIDLRTGLAEIVHSKREANTTERQ